MQNSVKNKELKSDTDVINDFSLFDSEGFLICPTCHERLEANMQGAYDITPYRIPVLCKCDRDRRDLLRAAEHLRELKVLSEKLRHESLMDPSYQLYRFEFDDRKDPKISDVCRNYVDNWQTMAANNVGIVMYGGVGTGKTFHSGCIGNALLDMGVPVIVSNIPNLIKRIEATGFGIEKIELFERLQKVDLLILDDLGAERGTEYVLEQVFQIVDARYRAGKPLIVTTNLAPSDLTNIENLGYHRIYDRILQNCLRLKITGNSRRTEIAAQKKEQFKNLLGL